MVATRLELQVRRYGARQMLALRRAIAASSLDRAAFAVSTFDIYLEEVHVRVHAAPNHTPNHTPTPTPTPSPTPNPNPAEAGAAPPSPTTPAGRVRVRVR